MRQLSKQPWETCPDVWKTHAQFITWVRGVLRKGWKNFPVKLEYLNSRKKRIKNTNPKSAKTHPTVWGWECEQCKQEVKAVEVDHAGTVQGKFTGFDEIQGYAEHLFLVDFDSLECVCVPCHATRSLAQKRGISFEQSKIEQKIILAMKDKVAIQIAKLTKLKYNDVSNAEKRKAAWTDYFNKQGAV
jgi:hypothetical protein